MPVQWSYQWARKFSVSRFEVLYHVVRSDFFKNEFGAQIDHFMIIPKEGNEALYVPNDEYNQFAQRIFEKLARSAETYQHYKAMIKQHQSDFVETAQHIAAQPLATATMKQLHEYYTTFFTVNNQFFNTAIWIPFCAEPIVSAAGMQVLETLVKRHGVEDQYQKHFDAIFLPDEKNAITREREALLDIVEDTEKQRHTSEHVQVLLDQHAAQYQWIPCYDINDTPWGVDDFKRVLEETQQSDWKNELRHLRLWNQRPVLFQQTIEALHPNEEQQLLLNIVHDMVVIKDERDDYRRQGSHAIQPLFNEIGRRMGGWTIDEVTALLSTELHHFFETGEKPPISDIHERLQGYVLLYQPCDIVPAVYSGDAAKKVMAEQLADASITHQTELHGICGSRGTATGTAAIVRTKKDLTNVRNGDVLVAVTTHPDFVPAMRRAAAIVTDEGGLTCHAAIVSRELGIPCVVGTKNATTVFANNDTIEVQGDTGVVKHIA